VIGSARGSVSVDRDPSQQTQRRPACVFRSGVSSRCAFTSLSDDVRRRQASVVCEPGVPYCEYPTHACSVTVKFASTRWLEPTTRGALNAGTNGGMRQWNTALRYGIKVLDMDDEEA